MATESIEQKLKEMLVERLFLRIKPDEIEDEKNLMENYGVDSVSVMEMAVGMEEEFGVSFQPNEFRLDNFETIRKMADFVRSKQ